MELGVATDVRDPGVRRADSAWVDPVFEVPEFPLLVARDVGSTARDPGAGPGGPAWGVREVVRLPEHPDRLVLEEWAVGWGVHDPVVRPDDRAWGARVVSEDSPDSQQRVEWRIRDPQVAGGCFRGVHVPGDLLVV